MKKQVVVVVHGVGVRAAGVATDLVSVALDDKPDGKPDATLAALPRGGVKAASAWLPHSSDDFLLRERGEFDHKGKVRTFGARLRRHRKYGGDSRKTVTDERVIADFYWGDISGTGSDVVAVLFGLLRVVFGLSHAVRENLASAFPDDSGAGRWLRRLGALSVLTIHGPIFALNLVLLGGYAVIKGLALVAPETDGWSGYPVVLGLAAAAIGAVGLLLVVRTYLMRLLMCWVILSGLALAVIGVTLPNSPEDGDAHVQAGNLLMTAMVWLWGLSLISALAMAIGWAIWRDQDNPTVPIALPAIGLMTLIWFVFSASVWAVLLKFTAGGEAELGAITRALTALPVAVTALVLIGLVAVWLIWRKAVAFRAPEMTGQSYLANRIWLAQRYRLIVGRALTILLIMFVVIVVAHGATVAACGQSRAGPCAAIADQLFWPATVTAMIPMLALIGAAIFGPLRTSVAMGIDVATDVLVYLNDHSWDHARNNGQATVFLERWLGLGPRQAARGQAVAGYWMRRRIQERLKVLMAQLIDNELPDDIVIISHSQGTVIAMDTIDHSGAAWRAAMPAGGRLRLITMGSPYTHLYNTYFPTAFPSHHDRPGLLRVDRGGNLDEWVNIFRLDDFIGTHIDPTPATEPNWPEEHPAALGGHTNYWVDLAVIPILKVKVSAEPGPDRA